MESIDFSGAGISHAATLTKLKTNRVALIDADFIKHHVASIRAKEIKAGEHLADKDAVIRITTEYMNNVFLNKIDDPMLFCFSGKSYNTFREVCALEKPYKDRNPIDNYDGESQDMFRCMQHIMGNYVSLLFEDLEADDIVCALQDPDHTYIASKDKDIKQKPGWHYHFSENKIFHIDEKTALYSLCYQLLAGDTVDNICGIPGYGEKKTTTFLQSCKNPSRYTVYILELYCKLYGVFKGTDMFVEMWNLVKMRENRGEHFRKKYERMFSTKDFMVKQLQP